MTRAQPGANGILVNDTGGDVTGAHSGRHASALATEFLARIEPTMPRLTAGYTGVSTFDDWPRTHSDSLSVSFLSYPDAAARAMRPRCGELRAAVVDAPGR